ncbi:MFS transporter [Candidatus Bathyarchaeota archaeon]|nr:MFS transporter [Candidatus Bathyarchaeota archaeon]
MPSIDSSIDVGGVLKSKRFTKVFATLFIISLILGVVGAANSIFLPLLMKEEELSYGLIGFVGALTGLGGGLAQLLAGVASDRGLDRMFLILSSTVFLSLSFLVSYVVSGLPTYVLVGLSVGLSTPIIVTISLAIISETASSRAMGRVMGSYRISRSIGWTIGNLIFGVLADLYGSKTILLYSFGFSLATVLASFTVPNGGRLQQKVESRGRVSYELALFLLSLGIMDMVASADNRFIPLLAVDKNLSKSAIGSITALGSLVEIPFMLISGFLTDRFDDRIVMAIGAAGFALAYYRFTSAQVFTDFAFAQTLRGISFALYFAASLALIGRLSRGAATVTGYYGLAQQVGVVVGPIVAGLIANYIGLTETFTILSLFSLVGAIPLISMCLKTRREK